METIKITKKQAIEKWNILNSLATNSDIPNNDGWYALSRAHAKLKSAVQPILDKRAEVEKEYIKRDKTGRFTNDLKDEYTFDDFEKAIEAIESGDEIEVEIYKIKLSTLKDATMTNMMTGKTVRIPPSVITNLDFYIIHDYEETKELEVVK
jgi:hypothetical protein